MAFRRGEEEEASEASAVGLLATGREYFLPPGDSSAEDEHKTCCAANSSNDNLSPGWTRKELDQNKVLDLEAAHGNRRGNNRKSSSRAVWCVATQGKMLVCSVFAGFERTDLLIQP